MEAEQAAPACGASRNSNAGRILHLPSFLDLDFDLDISDFRLATRPHASLGLRRSSVRTSRTTRDDAWNAYDFFGHPEIGRRQCANRIPCQLWFSRRPQVLPVLGKRDNDHNHHSPRANDMNDSRHQEPPPLSKKSKSYTFRQTRTYCKHGHFLDLGGQALSSRLLAWITWNTALKLIREAIVVWYK